MKKIDLQIVAIAVLVCTTGACFRKPPARSKQQVMQERIEARVEEWKADVTRQCVEMIELRAVAIVDSIFIAEAKANRDTSGVPLLPERPEKPDFTPPQDSLAVGPLLRPSKDTLH